MRIEAKDISPALTGDALMAAMTGVTEKRKVIADGFLYEKTILMMSADPGVGKSTIAAQMTVELAAGLPLFGTFTVPEPCKVFYIQAERCITEFLERINTLSKRFPILKDNIIATDEYQKFNLLNADHADLFVECILRDYQKAKVIIVDPIYCLVAGGLKDDVPASAFTKVMSRVHKETGSMLYYDHHTVKQQHDSHGNPIKKDDPFYGSQWLKAHCTGGYYIEHTNKGSILRLKKDNYGILRKEIDLTYDQEQGICYLEEQELPSIDRVIRFLNRRRGMDESFCFEDIQAETKLCTRTLRSLLLHTSIKEQLKHVSTIGNKHFYTVNHAQ